MMEWYYRFFECQPEGAKWWNFKNKHFWGGLRNKHGKFYRRVCEHCRKYQDMRNGKWSGYYETRLGQHFVAEFPPKKGLALIKSKLFPKKKQMGYNGSNRRFK